MVTIGAFCYEEEQQQQSSNNGNSHLNLEEEDKAEEARINKQKKNNINVTRFFSLDQVFVAFLFNIERRPRRTQVHFLYLKQRSERTMQEKSQKGKRATTAAATIETRTIAC